MKITILQPYGWCEGVATAVTKLKQIINQHKNKKIYLIGWLVHNEHLINDLTKHGVIALNDTKKSRLSLLKSIKDDDAVVVLSAHGTPMEAIKYGANRFEHFYDLTCKYVQSNMTLVTKLIKQGDYVIYCGKKNHPESNAILSIDKSIVLVESPIDIWKLRLDNNKRYALMNQTTISKSVATEVLSALSIRTHTINYINSTCRAASQRHNNILNLKNVDLLLVIGDKHSNNANQLVDLAQKKNIDTKIIQFKTDVTKQMLKGIKHLAIASATSVSSEEVKKIINYVKTTTIK